MDMLSGDVGDRWAYVWTTLGGLYEMTAVDTLLWKRAYAGGPRQMLNLMLVDHV